MKRWLAGALCAIAFPAAAAAHVLDGYLQSAQLAVKPTGVDIEVRLIPGVQVADRIFARIDTDGDGQISAEEEQSYATQVLRDLSLEVDDRPTALVLASFRFPTRPEMRDGVGTIHLHLTAAAPLKIAGTHTLYSVTTIRPTSASTSSMHWFHRRMSSPSPARSAIRGSRDCASAYAQRSLPRRYAHEMR